MFQIKGLGDFEQELKNLDKKFKKIGGTHSVPMEELLSPDFMVRFTNFSSFDELIEKSGYVIETQEDFDKIPDNEWDSFIITQTQFSSWQNMLELAGSEFVQKQFDS